jgi:hypothetical protein
MSKFFLTSKSEGSVPGTLVLKALTEKGKRSIRVQSL